MYVVIENTPGYLPEDDDPATFERREDALVYLSDRLSSYLNALCDADIEFAISQGDGWYFVTDMQNEHDLGRNFSVELCEPDA